MEWYCQTRFFGSKDGEEKIIFRDKGVLSKDSPLGERITRIKLLVSQTTTTGLAGRTEELVPDWPITSHVT